LPIIIVLEIRTCKTFVSAENQTLHKQTSQNSTRKANIRDIPTEPAAACPWKHPATQDQLARLLASSKSKVKKKIIEQWQEAWDYSRTGDFYRRINPMVSYKLKFHTNPRAKDVQITILRLGHVKLKNTLYTIGQATDPNCETCGVPEDI